MAFDPVKGQYLKVDSATNSCAPRERGPCEADGSWTWRPTRAARAAEKPTRAGPRSSRAWDEELHLDL